MFNNNYNIFNDLNNSSDEEEEQNNDEIISSNNAIISTVSKEFFKELSNLTEENYIIEDTKDAEDAKDAEDPSDVEDAEDAEGPSDAEDAKDAKDAEDAEDAEGPSDAEDAEILSDAEDAEDAEDADNSTEDEESKKYIEPKILNNISLNNFFSKEDILLSKNNNKPLQITDKGLYSITKNNDAIWITNLIIKFIKNETTLHPKNTTIIDSTSGIGGNSINFSRHFNKVNSIEINEIHYNVLKNNINALGIKNINIYHNNFLNLINANKLHGDIFFIDPPWGGKSYKSFKYFFLKIGKLPLINVLNILYENKFKYVVLKAPYNLNISLLVGSTKYDNINIYKSIKKNMLIVIFY